MYKSPIEVFRTGIEYQLENEIMSMVQKYGITVDRDELLRALSYDRDQYDKGYADGKRAFVDGIVRCTHCKYCKQDDYYKHELYCSKLSDDEHTYWVPVGFYCGYGEELEDD